MVMGLIVILFHGGVFERAVHAFHLAIRPGMVGFGEAVLDAILLADALKDMLKGVDIALAVGELPAVIGEHGVELVGDGGHQVAEELGGDHVVGFFVQLGIGKFTRPVNGDQQVELAFFRADLRDVDMDVAQGIGLELFLRRFLAFPIRHAVDAVPLQAAMESGSSQLRQCRLQGIQAIVERS
jgi:hypothetical protein